MIGFSRFLAWVYLVSSIVVAVVVITNYGRPQEVGVGIGIGLLVQGLTIFCLLMLVAKIAENTQQAQVEVNESVERVIEPKEAEPIQKDSIDVPVGQLHQAVWQGNYILAKKLIQLGADIQAKREFDGKTPMELAVERGDQLVIKLLVSYGAKA
ncbi:ankyrin repeat domain-containing protein [Shewanella algidipiscicola]|uniref:ankyrin repeat domain-containing protein n=1 Tax=Shewanella algidipiscicola TaxID=614070 RepID=UPI000D78B99E|nr:ankyrin repeat domain-containing protein [Shewanella algidipiscicola]